MIMSNPNDYVQSKRLQIAVLGLCFRLLEACEDLLDSVLFHFRRNQADDRNNDQTCQHGESAAVDGGLKYLREGRANQHVRGKKPCAKDEVYKYGELRHALPLHAKDERSKECSCECAP